MTPYFRIARDGLVELDAELPDTQLAYLKEGEKALVTLPTGEDPDSLISTQGPEAMAALPAEVRAGLNALRSNICFVQGDTTLNVPDLSRCQ